MILEKVTKTLGDKEVLKEISFSTTAGDKIGIIGINGSGKSTLLKIIAGLLPLDFGRISNREDVAYLKQEIDISDYNLSVVDYIKKESGFSKIENELNELQQNLNEKNLDRYGFLLEKFAEIDGYNIQFNIEKYLKKFEMSSKINNKICELSGGEKIKILLISMFLNDKNVLLLDEPTNNLDLKSIDILKDYLVSSKKTMLIVSHDKSFLSSVTNKTLKLENGNAKLYPYNYETYLNVKQAEYNKEYEDFLKKREIIKDVKKDIVSTKEKLAANKKQKAKDNDKLIKNSKIESSQNRAGEKIKKLSKELDELNKSVSEFKKKEKFSYIIERDDVDFNLKNIMFKDLVCGYDNFSTFKISANIKQGSRVLVTGSNGTGKSTLIKTLLGELQPKSGEILLDKNIKFGYLEQNTIADKQGELTVYEFLKENLKNVEDGLIFTVLHNFQIEYEDKNKKFNQCSAGERTKICLAKLSLEKINTLILDEPTNHLDLEASEILYDAVQNFNGTIFAISHNLSFVDILKPDVIINLDNGLVEYK